MHSLSLICFACVSFAVYVDRCQVISQTIYTAKLFFFIHAFCIINQETFSVVNILPMNAHTNTFEDGVKEESIDDSLEECCCSQ